MPAATPISAFSPAASTVLFSAVIEPLPANASSINWSASLIPLLTGTSITRLPAKRSA